MTDYSSEEFWKGAPKTSTHWQPPRGEGFSPVFWRVENGVPVEAWAVMGSGDLRHVPKPSYIDDVFGRLIARPAPPWSGDDLPPVGTSVVLDDECFPVFDDYRAMIGVPVVVTAAFKSPTGVDMIACALPGGLCGCFRADMARPTKTPAQIAAEERHDEINKMVAIFPLVASEHEIAAALYDAGLRFPKGDDQ